MVDGGAIVPEINYNDKVMLVSRADKVITLLLFWTSC